MPPAWPAAAPALRSRQQRLADFPAPLRVSASPATCGNPRGNHCGTGSGVASVWASLLDVTNAALKLAPLARAASAQRRLVFAGFNGTAAAVANSTCCSVINTGVRGDAPATSAGCPTPSGEAPNGARNSDISVPAVSVDIPGLRARLLHGRNLRFGNSDSHEYRTTCLSGLLPSYADLAKPDRACFFAYARI